MKRAWHVSVIVGGLYAGTIATLAVVAYEPLWLAARVPIAVSVAMTFLASVLGEVNALLRTWLPDDGERS